MKKRKTNAAMLALGLALPLLAIGCASEPTGEIDAANAALEAARQAEAEAYAPDAMQVAENVHTAMETELAQQKERFAMSRSYDKTRELAGETRRASEDAADAARAGKLKARENATNLLAEVRTSLDEVKTMLDSAPRGKGSAADLAALKGDLGRVDAEVTDIEQAISAERFLGAVQKAQAAMEHTNEIRAEITRAAERKRVAQ